VYRFLSILRCGGVTMTKQPVLGQLDKSVSQLGRLRRVCPNPAPKPLNLRGQNLAPLNVRVLRLLSFRLIHHAFRDWLRRSAAELQAIDDVKAWLSIV